MATATYRNLIGPPIVNSLTAVTLAATNKALYPQSAFPVLGGQYFDRPGKKLRIRLFGQMTTGATPGNLTVTCLYGTGADANGVALAASAAIALIASQTNITWQVEYNIRCVTTGSTGTLLANGLFKCNPALIASTAQPIMIPASAPAVSGSVDLTAALYPSIQVLRSGSTAETMQVFDMEVEEVV